MITTDRFSLFDGKAGANGIPRWYMSITMIFGSMLAGATSEGGAAVAFPVMTLVFGINPVVARDFSFLIHPEVLFVVLVFFNICFFLPQLLANNLIMHNVLLLLEEP